MPLSDSQIIWELLSELKKLGEGNSDLCGEVARLTKDLSAELVSWSKQLEQARNEVSELENIIQAIRQRDANKKCLCRGTA